MLVANIAVDVKIFALPALAAFPLEVVVAQPQPHADMPTVKGVLQGTIAQPIAQLSTHIEELLGMGIVAPRPPREEHFSLDAPAMAVAQGNLYLYVRCHDSQE